MRIALSVARGAIVVAALAALAACQSLPYPSGSPTPTGAIGGEDGGGGDATSSPTDPVDTSDVEGEPVAGGLVDPCSLLSADEVAAATGVAVLSVIRGAVQDDGSQLCAFAMDAQGSTAAAMAGVPGLPPQGIGSVVNGLKAGGAVVGVQLSAQDPDDLIGSDDESDPPPPEVQIEELQLGKAGFVVSTPNGGAAFAANEQNVLVTIMDLIAGPASSETLTTLVTTAYGRL